MEKNSNLIYDNGMFYLDKYEILFASGIPISEYETSNAVQFLNGAAVLYDNVDLRYTINWKEVGKSINSISFLMPRDDAYLKDIFADTPYGIIKKNRTGVGATTLELSSNRNSIIVVPTRALAYNKAINSKIDGEENKYRILYVGGNIVGFNVPSITDYLLDTSIEYKKFIVVADSLPKLLEQIGKENYKKYFLMVDEIDSYQYDSHYRPNMEDVIDYYFQFPSTQRCLVSATMSKFSNKAIEDEPIINIEFNEPQSRNIKLIHTNIANIRAKQHIEDIALTYPNDKILVAFNSVSESAYIINSLDEQLRNECAILCSAKNKDIVDYYCEISNNQLPKRISFMTCTYFVGIDISERFHLITVINSSRAHTVLSTDKLQQIAGRCRHRDGLLSETIIYTTKESNIKIDIDEVEKQVLKDANDASTFGNIYPSLKRKFTKQYLFRDDLNSEEFINGAMKSYSGSTPVRILRQNIFGNITPSFFNVDSVRIQVELLSNLYSKSSLLKSKLISDGNSVDFYSYNETTMLPDSVIAYTNAHIEESNQTQRKILIEQLKSETSQEGRKQLANSLRTQCSMQNSIFLEHFIELQKYVQFDTLVDKLNVFDTPREYNNFYNAVLFWSLEDEHPIKATVFSNFIINTKYTGDELTDKFNSIFSGILGYTKLTPRQALPIIKVFCKLSQRTSKRIDGTPTGAYKVLNYNYFELDGEPLYRIPANVNMRNQFRF